jgi:hypothetical protein
LKLFQEATIEFCRRAASRRQNQHQGFTQGNLITFCYPAGLRFCQFLFFPAIPLGGEADVNIAPLSFIAGRHRRYRNGNVLCAAPLHPKMDGTAQVNGRD